jgi:hypothetical protein
MLLKNTIILICYGIILITTIRYIVNTENVYKILGRIALVVPLILLGVGILTLMQDSYKLQEKQAKSQYEQVTETFYRKIK